MINIKIYFYLNKRNVELKKYIFIINVPYCCFYWQSPIFLNKYGYIYTPVIRLFLSLAGIDFSKTNNTQLMRICSVCFCFVFYSELCFAVSGFS